MDVRKIVLAASCCVLMLGLHTISFASDYSLPANGSSSGSLGNTNPSDYWQIVLTADGKLVVNTSSASTLDVDLYLYAADKSTQIYSASSYGVNELLKFNGAGAGTYYIRVYQYSGTGSYSITSTFTSASYDTDPENNNEAVNATVLAPNGNDTGHLGYLYSNWDSDDYWKITVPQDGKLVVSTVADTTLDIDLYMYDVDHSAQIASGSHYGAHESTYYNALEPGTYYVRAFLYAGYGGYTITSVFTPTARDNDPENNETIATAVTLPVNGTDTGHLGHHSLAKNDYDDYWKIIVPADGVLTISTVQDTTLDLDLYLYDQTGNTQLASATAYGAHETLKYNGLGAGTYYIRAFLTGWSYGSYSITSSLAQTPRANDPEPNGAVASATTAIYQQTYTGHLGHKSQLTIDSDDYYQITVPSGLDTLYVRTLSDSTLDLDIYVYSSNGTTQLASGTLYGTIDYATLIKPAAGTYLIRMFLTGYTWGSYTFVVSNTTLARPDFPLAVEQSGKPDAFGLLAPYPNPFNPNTTIAFTIPEQCPVRLAVYDIIGREVAVLADASMTPGRYSFVWNARDRSGERVGNGVYFFHLTAGSFTANQKATLIK